MSAISVDARFCGPPGVANGGYLAGRLAVAVDAGTVSVRLRRPTPLDRPLQQRRDGSAVELLDGDEVLARAEPSGSPSGVDHRPRARRTGVPPRVPRTQTMINSG